VISVFLVQHLHLINGDEEDVKIIGVYRTYDSAVSAVGRLKTQPGFCEFPRIVDPLEDEDLQGFSIDECLLDEDNWAEGYKTWIS
jgi:homoserine kinase type II